MRFEPPRCPYSACPSSRHGAPFPWSRRGSFPRKCDGRRVQRFECGTCGRRFSVQSFRLDYRLRSPGLNAALLAHFVSKVTHRQSARLLRVSRKTVLHRVRLLGAHCREFHRVRLECASLAGTFVLDELETFETDRRLQPVTMPVLVHWPSLLIVHQVAAPLPARGRLRPADQRRKLALERLRGPRKSGSSAAVVACCEVLRNCLRPGGRARVRTDRKATYRAILRDVFGARAIHECTSGSLRRNHANPLFAVNHTFAMVRDGVSRLVRRTWANAKLRERLAEHTWIWVAWRNYVRGVTNVATRTTPAMAAGILCRQLDVPDLVRWQARFPELLRVQPAGPASVRGRGGRIQSSPNSA